MYIVSSEKLCNCTTPAYLVLGVTYYLELHGAMNFSNGCEFLHNKVIYYIVYFVKSYIFTNVKTSHNFK